MRRSPGKAGRHSRRTMMFWALLLAMMNVPLAGLGARPLDRQSQPPEVAEVRRLEEEAVKLYQQGRYEEAIPLVQRALTISEAALGAEHPGVVGPLNSLALLYHAKGDYTAAVPLVQRGLQITEKVLGAGHPQVAVSLNMLAALHHQKGNFQEAESLYRRALKIRETTLGPDHPQLATSLNNLAELYRAKGDLAQAEPLYQRGVRLLEKALGPEHPQLALQLNNLAELYRAKGDYAQAEPLYQRALKISEAALGREHPQLALQLNNLAELYRAKGDLAQAEPLYQRALKLLEKAKGSERPEVASLLNNLALLYQARGDYAQGEALYQRALKLWEQALGAEHPQVATPLNNLAELYSDKGDYAQAELFYQRALKIMEKALGPEHSNVAFVLNNLGLLSEKKGDYALSEAFHQRALKIWEKALGPEHPEVATSLNNLAELYRQKGDNAQVESLYQRALKIWEKVFGPEHPNVASVLNNLGLFYRAKGDYARAEPLYLRALKIWEKAYDAEHPKVVGSLTNLAVLYQAKGDTAQALQFLARAIEGQERHLTRFLLTGSERQKQLFLASLSDALQGYISMHVQQLAQNPQAAQLALTAILQRKGRTLDATTEQFGALRRRAAPQDAALFNQLLDLRSQQAALELDESKRIPLEQRRARLQQLNTEAEQLGNTLSQRSAALRPVLQPITLAAVQQALPAEAALVEFFVAKPFELNAKPGQRWGAPRYVVYVLRRDGTVRFADLGEAAPLEQVVNEWRAALQNRSRSDVKALARKLDALVMQPVRALVGEAQHLLLSPDGTLNLIPFAALVDEQERFLLERFRLSYLTSGRDLLRLQATGESKQAPLVLADPDFNAPATGDAATNNTQRGLADFKATPLPGTAAEAAALKQLFPQATVLTGAKATEAALKQTAVPQLLHIATHGFFLADPTSAPPPDIARSFSFLERSSGNAPRPPNPLENPLLRSGLTLAGFNQHRSGPDDGVLTALEATGLDLWGTKLVVLSACETGVGEVRNGEGVYGLRRAFVLAGAETQVISLWQVDDKATQELMTAYYQRLLAGEGRAEALRQVQLAMLRSQAQSANNAARTPGVRPVKESKTTFAGRSHPYYWASFIPSGEWANLAGKR